MPEIQDKNEAIDLYLRALRGEDLSAFIAPLLRAFLRGVSYTDCALTAISEPARQFLEQHPKSPRATRRNYEGGFIGTDEERSNAQVALLLLRLHLLKIPELRFTWGETREKEGSAFVSDGLLFWSSKKKGCSQSFDDFLTKGAPVGAVPSGVIEELRMLFSGPARQAQSKARQHFIEKLKTAAWIGCESCGHLPEYFHCYEKDGDPWHPAGWAMEIVAGYPAKMMVCRLCGTAYEYYYDAGDLGMDPYMHLKRLGYEAAKGIAEGRPFIP